MSLYFNWLLNASFWRNFHLKNFLFDFSNSLKHSKHSTTICFLCVFSLNILNSIEICSTCLLRTQSNVRADSLYSNNWWFCKKFYSISKFSVLILSRDSPRVRANRIFWDKWLVRRRDVPRIGKIFMITVIRPTVADCFTFSPRMFQSAFSSFPQCFAHQPHSD